MPVLGVGVGAHVITLTLQRPLSLAKAEDSEFTQVRGPLSLIGKVLLLYHSQIQFVSSGPIIRLLLHHHAPRKPRGRGRGVYKR